MDSYLQRQKSIVDEIIHNIIFDKYQTINLCGPSGSGKSHLIQEIISALNANGNDLAVILLNGDAGKQTIDYAPLNGYMERKNKWKKGVGAFVEGLSYIGPGIRYLLDTTDFRHIREKEDIIRDNRVFRCHPSFSKELFLLFKKHKQVILLCDDIHFFDQATIDYFRGIISYFNSKNCKINIISSYNTRNAIVPYTFSRHHSLRLDLQYPSKEDMPQLLCLWGLSEYICPEDIDAIYAATGGHLLLINQVCHYYAHEKPKEYSSEINDELFLGDLLERRINETTSGNLVTYLLETLATIGRSATINELKCALNDVDSLNQIIRDAVSLNLLSKELTTVSFISDTIREISLRRSHLNKKEFFIRYAQCLKSLMPSEYERRSLAEELAGNHINSQILKALHIINLCREGLFSYDLTCLDEPEVLLCVKVLVETYRLSFEGKNENALKFVKDKTRLFTKPLLAIEVYFVTFTLEFKSNRIDNLEDTLSSLIGLINNCDQEEVELWSRLMRLRITLESSMSKLEDARSTHRQHQQKILSRTSFDGRLAMSFYECQLLSDTLYEPDAAHQMLLELNQALRKKVLNGEVEYILLYYKALINLSGNNLMIGQFEAACKCAWEAVKITEKCDFMQFPCLASAFNNYLLARYFQHSISVPDLSDSFQHISTALAYDEDKILLSLNHAGFLLESNHFKEALSVIDSLQIKQETFDAYYTYYYTIDRALVEYFLGNIIVSIDMIDSLLNVVDSAFQTRRRYYKEHYRIVSQLIHDNCTYESLHAMQDAFSLIRSTFLSSDWEYYKRVYLFSELQIWTQL